MTDETEGLREGEAKKIAGLIESRENEELAVLQLALRQAADELTAANLEIHRLQSDLKRCRDLLAAATTLVGFKLRNLLDSPDLRDHVDHPPKSA